MIMRICSVILFLCFFSLACNAQSKSNFQLGLGMDLFKTDNNGFAEKSQVGLEGNYFFTSKFSGTLGLDFWSARGTSLILGMRFYPVDPVFIKFRGYVGIYDDVTLGMGYSKSLGSNFSFEGGMDYYFQPRDLGLRFGLAYLF